MTHRQFWDWLSASRGRLETSDPDDAVGEIIQKLKEVDSRLSAELGRDPTTGERDLIVTAHGDKSAFALVRELVDDAPAEFPWGVTPLKPGAGFDFVSASGELSVRAAELAFEPLQREGTPSELAIRVYLPGGKAPDVERGFFVQMIVDTGLGEEASAEIEHIECAEAGDDPPTDPLVLEQLPAYVAWHRRRHPIL